ncbi:hypothetical protein GQ53DRAFT_596595, partial [Thozetella sp. PMI_491]
RPKPMNPVRRIMEREQRVRDRNFKQAEAAAAAASATPTSPGVVNSNRQQCPNPTCPKPNVVDGTCRTCGRVADDSNIVAEVTFGENSAGAAVVQGSYLAADQGGVRGVSGRDFRRVAGSGASEAREKGVREAKALMNQLKHHLNIPDSLVESGVRMYRIASTMNFMQGRDKRDCACVILYAACRQEPSCKVMLIDFADFVKTDVFKLGRQYKDFLAILPNPPNVKHVVPEDLIWRFAAKLEFYRDTNRVAEAAIRIIQRMRYDEMTHGRRPAGICGAALVMAARSLNYRRTVREVVYIAKVTMVTIQNRLDEFAMVPSANMTVDEFNTQSFLKEHHDPPFFYKQKPEWKDKHTRPRKRKQSDQDEEGETQDAGALGSEKRQKISGGAPSASSASAVAALPSPTSTPAASQSTQIAPGPSRLSQITDKDGFVIPPRPERLGAPEQIVTPSEDERGIVLRAATGDAEQQLEYLADEFGDDAAEDQNSEIAMAARQGVHIPGTTSRRGNGPGRTGGSRITMPIDEVWENDEQELEAEVERYLQDPEAIAAAQDVADHASQANDAPSQTNDPSQDKDTLPGSQPSATADQAADSTPGDEKTKADILPPGVSMSEDGTVSMAREVHEDEFKNDPEVTYCLLSEDEMRLKEQIWSNQNKDYMRLRQQKYFKDKREAKQPTKVRRRTGKRAKTGLEHASPASSAAEAAGNVMKTRAVSSRLNYQAMYDDIFASSKRGGPGSTYGGASSVGSRSAVTSRAGSAAGSDDENGLGSPSPPPRAMQSAAAGKSTGAPAQADAGVAEDDEDDYVNNPEENDYDDGEGFQQDEVDPFADD